MIKRLRYYVRVSMRRAIRHPAIAGTATVMVLAVLLWVGFHYFETTHPDTQFESYSQTLKGMLILVISGYDIDPEPQSEAALLCAFLLMLTGLGYVTLLGVVFTAALVESKLRKGLTVKKVPFENHILLCGRVKNAREILDQLFAPDLKTHHPVVIIDPHIEEAPRDHPDLAVIQGDPTETAVLEQANAKRACAAIILADRENENVNVADARSLLIVLAIETIQPEIYSCVEVLNPDNAVHFRRVNADEEIPVAKVSNSLVVQSALNPGLSRIITDMLTFGEGEELYRLAVPPAFVGKTFTDLGTTLMQQEAMVLIGVASEDGQRIVNSHRAKYVFQEEDYIFVLAEDEPEGLDHLQPEAAPGG